MSDETMREFVDEDDRAFYEEMRAMSDADLLAKMKQVRDGLIADDGKLARELGFDDEYVRKISSDIENLEKAMRVEQLANQQLEETTLKMNAAADRLLASMDPEYPDILSDGGKKGH